MCVCVDTHMPKVLQHLQLNNISDILLDYFQALFLF